MRHRSNAHRQKTRSILDSAETLQARAKAAQWLSRLLDLPITLDDEFFSFLGWCVGDLQRVACCLQKKMAEYPHNPDYTQLRRAVKALQATPEKYLKDKLGIFFSEFGWFQSDLRDIAREMLINPPDADEGEPLHLRTRERIKKFFGLNSEAMKVCQLAFVWENFPPVADYFEGTLQIQNFESIKILAYMLGMPTDVCRETLLELEKIGIIETLAAGIRLCESINTVFLNDDIKSLQKVFCQPLKGKALSLEEFTISDEEKRHVIKLLRHTTSRPVHILLYGAPGTGKTSFAHSLASELKLKAWAVPCHEGDTSQNRRASLTTCLRMAANHKNSFVLVDEAERLLDTGESMDGSSSSKAWLTAFLEMPGQRVIWISNHVSDIDQAVRRRFTYSIHFEALDRNARREMWLRTMQRLHVEERIPTETVEAIAEHYEAPVAVMEHALHQAKMLAPREGFAACVERVLTAYTTLANDGEKDERKEKRKGTYSLDGICTVKPFAPQIEHLRRLDAYLRDNEDTCAGMGTLLFYGPPGTGKTALAKHIGKVLDRKCCIKRGSDLLSPYVGEAEKNIATAFNTASHNGDILIIDEVDSFLTKRENTRRSWEVSQVNEFLTALECFSGLCICTTNRREDMDPAVMRRFSFKIAFGYAGPAQLQVLYDKLLAPLVGKSVPQEIRQRLCAQKNLTPGDFHAVRMQHWLEETGALSHQKLLEALLLEQASKLDKGSRRMGFLAAKS